MSNRIAIVTGAGTGVGKASAVALIKAGFSVVFAGRRAEPLAEAIAAAGASPANALAVPTDVASEDSVKALFDAAVQKFGRVDVVCSSTALHWLAVDELDRALEHAFRSLRPGGILLNADHLGYADVPSFTSLAGWMAARDAAAAIAGGAISWHEWWEAVRSDAQLASFCVQRDEVFPPMAQSPEEADEIEAARASAGRRPPLLGFIDAALRAGFVEVDTIWQRFDDRVVMAVKAASSDQ